MIQGDVLWDPRTVYTGDIQGGSRDVLRDPPDSVEGCVCRGHPGRMLMLMKTLENQWYGS